MNERQIEEKMASYPRETGRFQGGRFDQANLSIRGEGYPMNALAVWNERKRFFPVVEATKRIPARIRIAGVTCVPWQTLGKTVYGKWVVKGNDTGIMFKASFENITNDPIGKVMFEEFGIGVVKVEMM